MKTKISQINMPKISIIGSGNLATHLGSALQGNGYSIAQVCSKNIANAKELSNGLNCEYTDDLSQLMPVDLVIIAVNDDAIEEVSKQIQMPKVHTSGSKSIGILGASKSPIGVFYPLQTFSKNKKVDFKNIPFCIEGSNKDFTSLLLKIAADLSDNVHAIDSEQRKKLHLAAVISCNFSNLLYQFSEEICQENDIDFNVLKPLILETANKIQSTNPKNAQTGPAKRNDTDTMKSHVALLKDNNELKSIYTSLSNSIIKRK